MMPMMRPYESIIALLTECKVPYREVEHKDMFRSDQEEEVTGLPAKQGAKSILLKAKETFVLAVLPGDERVSMKKVKALLKVKSLRFANDEEIKEKLGCEAGACYPFGNLVKIRTIVDPILGENKEIAFNPGVHNRSIIITFEDYKKIANPEVHSIVDKQN
jgi:Ala-tRNA(Pro) deacylase